MVLEGVSVDVDVMLISDVPIALCAILSDEDVSSSVQYLDQLRGFINTSKKREKEFKEDMYGQYGLTEFTPVSYLEEDGRVNCGFVPYLDLLKTETSDVQSKRNIANTVHVTSLDGATTKLHVESVHVIEHPLIAAIMYYLRSNVTGPGTDPVLT
jgi:hypothetical protein